MVHKGDNLDYLVAPVKRVVASINKTGGKAETDDVVSVTVEFESGASRNIGGNCLTLLPNATPMSSHT